ncbi:flagellar protein FlgN [Anoxybacteroides amylolyticum]|uniref:FlgN family protein n=1 Tax=Anoxybacteroides amylolyticum TaxID=294699 RepID=A0A160F3L9_9BACL|nr:flagellar protein FlgN [Anoxybacillus amylolyticus]ANB60193.1 flgN family protein [Anoxybacillus amylolyticus]
MSATPLVDLLEKYLTVHEQLLQSSRKKTEVLKKGDTDALMTIVKEEQKILAMINQMEKKRMELMTDFAHDCLAQDLTLTACIELAPSSEQVVLKRLQDQLLEVMAELKEVNELNQQLIEQSLQFVNMTLQLILPQPQEISYRHPHSTSLRQDNSWTIFDSKA